MNSLTEMPLRTWTFLNTSSAISGFSVCPAWPCANATASSHAAPVAPKIVRRDPSVISSPSLDGRASLEEYTHDWRTPATRHVTQGRRYEARIEIDGNAARRRDGGV